MLISVTFISTFNVIVSFCFPFPITLWLVCVRLPLDMVLHLKSNKVPASLNHIENIHYTRIISAQFIKIPGSRFSASRVWDPMYAKCVECVIIMLFPDKTSYLETFKIIYNFFNAMIRSLL